MPDNSLTREIIGAAIEVHKLLGPGLIESTYEHCLCHEFTLRGLPFERQRPIPLVYKGIKLECGFRLDLLVRKRVIVELKSIEALSPVHEAIILTYLRLSGYELGLLINFNVSVLKDGVRRFMMPRDPQGCPRVPERVARVAFGREYTEDAQKNAGKENSRAGG
jgi:GxxExxY protein